MKIHETSLNIDTNIKDLISQAAEFSGKSSSFLAKKLIKMAYSANNEIILKNKLIEYQDKSSSNKFTILRYRLNEDDRIEFSSARVRLCISISKLLLVGFFLFFRKLINKYIKKINKEKEKKTLYNYTAICTHYANQVIDFLISINYKPKKE